MKCELAKEWTRDCRRLGELIDSDAKDVGQVLNGAPLNDYRDIAEAELELLNRCEGMLGRMW